MAARAGHSVEVLLRVYAKCLDDGEAIANKRIDAALHAVWCVIPRTAPRDPPDQARCTPAGRDPIPRISRDQRRRVAFGGIWLHGLETIQGGRGVTDLVF